MRPFVSPMSPLRVAHVLRKYDAAELGGTETHVAEMVARLPSLGFECEVHAPRGPREAKGLGIIRYRAHCPFLGAPERRQALRRNAGNLVSFEEPLRLAFDTTLSLAHLHTGGRIGGGVRTAMRLTGRPYLLSVHGPLLSGGAFLAEDTARRLAGLVDVGRPLGLLLGARRVIDDAARVLCFNDEEHAALQARVGASAVRMDHGVDAQRMRSGEASAARRKFGLGNAPLVLQVARLCAQKDQLLAVRAFAAGAPCEYLLVLAGAETDRGYRAAVEAEARALGVGGRVRFLGNVAPTEVPDLLAAATLCLAPSGHEAFGLVALEAWAANRPVLFSRRGGLADLARALGPSALMLDSREPRQWAEAMAALLGDAELRARAAEAGARLVGERFSWDSAASRLAAIYREVLEERARGRAA